MRDAEPQRVIAEADLPALAAEAAVQPDTLEALPLEGDAPAALVYTSGTTGTSKGAILTHNNFAANAINLLTCWEITDRDRFLLTLPLFHVHALGNGLHCWLASGCRMRLLERFDQQHGRRDVSALSNRRYSSACRPSMCVCSIHPAIPPAKSGGGCGCSSPVPRRFRPRFWRSSAKNLGHTILERYGMSETLMNLSNPYAGERRPGSVGFPLPGISVRIDDTGELHLKGPNVFAGYWKRQDATREAFVDGHIGGWFKTGDIATRSAGRLLHPVRTPQRPDYLRRLQHLSAGDRRVPGRK